MCSSLIIILFCLISDNAYVHTCSAGDDYLFPQASRPVTFAPNQNSRVISVAIVDDGVFEGTEAFVLELALSDGGSAGDSSVKLGSSQSTVTIIDNDGQSVQINSC